MILNKPFTRKQRADLAAYCNDNNCHIEDNGKYLEAVKDPEHIPTAEEKIAEFKAQLAAMDYKGQKYIDGEYTSDEWAPIKKERQSLRQKIRELEK